MAVLQLKNVPDELVKRIEFAAVARRHDFVEEIVDRLIDSFGPRRIADRRTPEELRQLARQVRGEGNVVGLTPEFIRMAREFGRE